MIAVIAHVTARPETSDEVGAVLRSLVAPSRAHDGCVLYYVHTDPDDDCHFIFYEQWESRAHLDTHLARPDFASMTAPFESLAPEIEMRIFDVDE